MSVLDALDATRICARSSAALAGPEAWLMAAPSAPRRTRPRTEPAGYSWWSLLRNPHAILVTGMLGPLAAKDAVIRYGLRART